jgi:hypothetical protein
LKHLPKQKVGQKINAEICSHCPVTQSIFSSMVGTKG